MVSSLSSPLRSVVSSPSSASRYMISSVVLGSVHPVRCVQIRGVLGGVQSTSVVSTHLSLSATFSRTYHICLRALCVSRKWHMPSASPPTGAEFAGSLQILMVNMYVPRLSVVLSPDSISPTVVNWKRGGRGLHTPSLCSTPSGGGHICRIHAVGSPQGSRITISTYF